MKLNLDLHFLNQFIKNFITVSDLYEPIDDGTTSKLFITSSYDATTHFESTCLDILDVYRRYIGEPFDFTKVTRGLDADDNQEGVQ